MATNVDLSINRGETKQLTFLTKNTYSTDNIDFKISCDNNPITNGGFEVVTSLPTTNLFAGREVMYNGKKYVYSSGWKEVITANTMYEANLRWGGGNISYDYSPIDAAIMSELSANVMAFPNPAGISVEYSRDGGVTWDDYGATDGQKVNIFTTESWLYCGKSYLDGLTATVGYQLRITFTPADCGLYTMLNKIIMKVTRNGGYNCWATFKGLKTKEVVAGNEDDTYYDTFVNKATIDGWPSYNVINFDSIQTSSSTTDPSHANLYYRLRLIFGYDSVQVPSYKGLIITQLRFFGKGRFALPSNLARYNHLYTYDWKQNALFPAKVESKEVINFDVNNIEPTQTGSSVTKTSTWLWQYLVQGVNWLKANKFSGSYNDLTNTPNLATVATSGSYNDLTNTPTQLPNPNPITIKTAADGVSVIYDGSASGAVILEAGDNATVTATQDSDDVMTVKFDAVVPQTLPNPNALNITVLTSEGALLGPSMVYDGVDAKYLKLTEGYGIQLSNTNLNNSHEVTINLKQIAGTTLLGNANDTIGIPQAVTMTQLRTMLGSLTLNDTAVTLGGNNSYTLPCYISVGGTLYQARITNNWLQIYRAGEWANAFYLLTYQPTECRYITDLSDPSWYDESVTEYELDDSATDQLLRVNSPVNLADLLEAIGAHQITFNSSVIPSKQFNKGALDNIINNLKGKGYSVFVENDIDTILGSGNDWFMSIKIKKVGNPYKAIIECYVAK